MRNSLTEAGSVWSQLRHERMNQVLAVAYVILCASFLRLKLGSAPSEEPVGWTFALLPELLIGVVMVIRFLSGIADQALQHFTTWPTIKRGETSIMKKAALSTWLLDGIMYFFCHTLCPFKGYFQRINESGATRRSKVRPVYTKAA